EPLSATTTPADEWEQIASAQGAGEQGLPPTPPAADPYPAPVPLAGGELVVEDERLGPAAAWRGARPPRDPEPRRGAVAEQAVYPRRGGLRVLLGIVATVVVVILVIALLLRGREGVVQAEPGTAVLAVADFGEGAAYSPSGVGQQMGQSIRNEALDGL